MLKLLISDMDGTLLSTEEANLRAYQRSFQEVGVRLTPEAYRAAFGLRFDAMVERVASHLPPEDREHVRRRKIDLYPSFFGDVLLNHALVEFLRFSRPRHTVALATTSSRANAEALLKHFGLTEDFDQLVFGEDVKHGKPDPECYRLLIERVGARPGETLVFEDSEMGVAAAEAAGAQVMRVQL